MLKRCCLLPFVIFLGLTGFAQKQDEVRLFEPGQIVEREIAGGQTHAYQITLAARQFLRVEVEEKGIEVALTLSAPDGEQVAEADFARPFKASASVACGSAAAARPPCPEWLSYVAAASGAYRLTILVMLSACQTGLGKEIKGEGLVGLTRGFMYAGAARVVVSLWSVNDRATAELMAKFYRKMLKENQRPAVALRSAQVEMWRSSQWQSPYFWAAFVLQGEWK
jgi:CHAT domain